MNKYLSAGLNAQQRGELVFAGYDGIGKTENEPVNISVLKSFIDLKSEIKSNGTVSRDQMRSITPFIDAAKNTSLALWTEQPSATSVEEAVTLLDAGISEASDDALSKLFSYVEETLENNLIAWKENGDEFHTVFTDMLKDCKSIVEVITELNRDDLRDSMNNHIHELLNGESEYADSFSDASTLYIKELLVNPDQLGLLNLSALGTSFVSLLSALEASTAVTETDFDIRQWHRAISQENANMPLLEVSGLKDLPFYRKSYSCAEYRGEIVESQEPVSITYSDVGYLEHFRKFFTFIAPTGLQGAITSSDAIKGSITNQEKLLANIGILRQRLCNCPPELIDTLPVTTIHFLKNVATAVSNLDTLITALIGLTKNIVDYYGAVKRVVLAAEKLARSGEIDREVVVPDADAPSTREWAELGGHPTDTPEAMEEAHFARIHSEIEADDGYTREAVSMQAYNIDADILVMEGFWKDVKHKLHGLVVPDAKTPAMTNRSSYEFKRWLKTNTTALEKTVADEAWVKRHVHDVAIKDKELLQALSLNGTLGGSPVDILITSAQIFNKDFLATIKLVENRDIRLNAAIIEAKEKFKKADADGKVIAAELLKDLKKIPKVPELEYPKNFATGFGTVASKATELPVLDVSHIVAGGKRVVKEVFNLIEGACNRPFSAGFAYDGDDIWDLLDAADIDSNVYDEISDNLYWQDSEHNNGCSDALYDHLCVWFDTVQAVLRWLYRSTDRKEALSMQGLPEGELVMLDAMETARKSLTRMVQLLKSLIDWILKGWKQGSCAGSIKQAAANGPLLSKATDSLITDSLKQRLSKLLTNGVDTIIAYSKGGSGFYSTYRSVTDQVPGLMTTIQELYKQVSRGEPLSDGALDGVDKTLEVLITKSDFADIVNSDETVNLNNVNTLMIAANTKLKTAFQTPGKLDVTVQHLLDGNNACRDFLKEVVQATRLKISGHELDGALNTLNSIVRLQANNPNNPGLAELKDRVASLRNVIEATTTMLAILSRLERGAKKYVAAIASMLSSVLPKDELSQQGYTYHVDYGMLPCDIYQECARYLVESSFSVPRERLLRNYTGVIQDSVEALREIEKRRREIQLVLVGRIQHSDETNVSATLSGQLAGKLGVFRSQLVKAYNLYRESYRDDLSSATDALSSVNTLGDEIASRMGDDNMVEFYRKLVGQSTIAFRDGSSFPIGRFLSLGIVPDSDDSQSEFMEGRPLMEEQKIDDFELRNIQSFATVFSAAVSAYIALEHSIDSIVYRHVAEGDA